MRIEYRRHEDIDPECETICYTLRDNNFIPPLNTKIVIRGKHYKVVEHEYYPHTNELVVVIL